jgi:pyridoxal phosphate enzyme (YggS family)
VAEHEVSGDETAALLARYHAVRTELDSAAKAAGRAATDVRLVAVSKVHPYESIRTLYEAGQRDFGENYAQELIEKAERAQSDDLTEIRWHFIGHLQTNKVKVLLPHVAMIHGVGSLKLAEEISKRSDQFPGKSGRIPVLLEVNVDGQESKSGVQISELRTLATRVRQLPNLNLQGLMCIPDPGRAAGAREAFHRIAALAADLGLPELSMGMTSDFGEAIAERATLVRIGTAIFGERSPREKV